MYYANSHQTSYKIGIVHLLLFFLFLIVIEVAFRVYKSKETPFPKSEFEYRISEEEFRGKIKKGEKLVILDDMVLNVEKFMPNHPGGKFLIEKNIGRDISKYFYGGYSLENQDRVPPHKHSNIARHVVKSLAICGISHV